MHREKSKRAPEFSKCCFSVGIDDIRKILSP